MNLSGKPEPGSAGFRFGILASLTWVLFTVSRLPAQDLLLDELPALKEKALVLRITTRIAENSQEVWNAYNSKVTIPGRPVSIKLVGENLVIAIQFTPYTRGERSNALVAQSQIWLNVPDKGIHYKTTTHSIPMDFGESIYFFPLGSGAAVDAPHIELLLTLYRYGEEPEEPPDPAVPAGPEETPGKSGNPAPPPEPPPAPPKIP
ncbi:MAG: hypothetical protein LBE02_08920 [Spirochaetaceae bacterium]|nr:hypothetical protein [Spirochaetaceae bacterium]